MLLLGNCLVLQPGGGVELVVAGGEITLANSSQIFTRGDILEVLRFRLWSSLEMDILAEPGGCEAVGVVHVKQKVAVDTSKRRWVFMVQESSSSIRANACKEAGQLHMDQLL